MSKEKSIKLSKKMISFLEIVGNLSEGIFSSDFQVIKKESLKLVQLTDHNKITKSGKNLVFSSMKTKLSQSAKSLYLSAEKKILRHFRKIIHKF